MISNVQLWAGRILSGLAALFLLWNGVMKLLKPAIVVKATLDLGYPESDILGIGLVLLAGTLTGYLGGAIASQVRVQAS